MKILHIVGNRPQFIKLAVLYPALAARTGQGFILHTGQHYDDNMSAIFFNELHIPFPNASLGINSIPHNEMIGNMIIGIDQVIGREKPDAAIIYGDTNTTLAGAIAARKRNVRVIHIEAGVRTGDLGMPEEINRILSDRVAAMNFCSTYLGVENLLREGFGSDQVGSQVFNCGDLMLDAATIYGRQTADRDSAFTTLDTAGEFLLATIHRAENTVEPGRLEAIVEAFNEIDQRIPVLMPLHPRTKEVIGQCRAKVNFTTTGPLGYMDMLGLLQKSSCVITDSGGLSREAFFFCKPTLVVMGHPFWPEIIAHGNVLQSKAISADILANLQLLLTTQKPFKVDIFGDGRSAEKISEAILRNC